MDDADDIAVEDFSMEDLEKDLKKGCGGRRWLWFLIGLGVGVGCTLVAPRYLAPYLPDSLRGSREILIGPVLAMERTDGRVLLTIAAEPGAFIASFTERVDEIALLVDPGDIVTIAVPDYEPFVENPDLEGVKKGSGTQAGAEENDPAADDDHAQDVADSDTTGDAEGDGEPETDSSEAAADHADEETAAVGEAAETTPDTTATPPR